MKRASTKVRGEAKAASTASILQADAAFARGMLVVSIFALLSGLARIGQDAAVAWRYGIAPVVDAYYLLLSVASWPMAVALATLTMLVAPAEAALRQAGQPEASRFRAELLGATLLFALLATPPACLLLQHLAARTTGDGASQGAAWSLSLLVPLGLVAALMSAWLVAGARHVLTLLESLPPLVLVLALLCVPVGPVLFWGSTAGLALQVLAMAVALRCSRALPRPRLGLQDDSWRPFCQGAWALLAGQALFSLVPLVDPFWARDLGEGAVASLSYANRLVLGLQGLAGLALQRAGLPLLSRWMVDDVAAARRLAWRWALAAAAAGALLGLTVALLADPLVALLYERGRFSASDGAEVARLLRHGMWQMPIFLGGLVVVTALASARARLALAVVAAVGLLAKLALSAWLAPRHGTVGLMWSTAGMYVATTSLAWWALRRRGRWSAPVGRHGG